jgi:hypothetical protein
MKLAALALTLALTGLLPGAASATWWYHEPSCTPDSVNDGSIQISDPVSGNFWTFEVHYEVFDDDNCANPKSVKGSFTYVYTVTLTDQGVPFPISLNELRVLIDDVSYVADAGTITGGPGIAPTSVTVTNAPTTSVAATFATGDLTLGDSSLPIYIVSPYRPGSGAINLQVSLFSGTGPAVVPSELPDACPCTTSFWKLRALSWPFLGYAFPGSQFEDVKAKAVAISGGYYSSKSDLLNALFTLSLLDVKKLARRELSSLLLNVAGGELFPGNTRCRLFQGTQLDVDDDGVADSTVGEAIGEIIANLQSNDWFLMLEALQLATDINNGSNVIGAVHFN